MNRLIRAGMFFFLVSIMVLQLFALPAPAKSPELDRVYASLEGAWYINAKTMVHPDSDTASFWSTVVPHKGGMYYGVLAMVLEKRGKNPDRLEYVQILHEVDCSIGEMKYSTVLFYDKQDRIVLTVNSPGSAKLIADFGQAPDNILAAVCGQNMARLTKD